MRNNFVKFERGMILNIFFDKRTSMFFKILLGALEMSLEIYVSYLLLENPNESYIYCERKEILESNSIFLSRRFLLAFDISVLKFVKILPPFLLFLLSRTGFLWKEGSARDSSVSLSFRFNLRKETNSGYNVNNGGRSSRRRCVRVTVADETNNCWKIPGLHRPRPPCY